MAITFDPKTRELVVDRPWTRHMLEVAKNSTGIPFDQVNLVVASAGSVTLDQYDVPASLRVWKHAKVTIMNATIDQITNQGGSIRLTNTTARTVYNLGQISAYMSRLQHVENTGTISASKTFFYKTTGTGMLRAMSSVIVDCSITRFKSVYLNKTYLIGCKLPDPFVSHPMPGTKEFTSYSNDNQLMIRSLHLLAVIESKLTDPAAYAVRRTKMLVTAIEKLLYEGARIPSCYADLLLTNVVFAATAHQLLMGMPVTRNYVRNIIPAEDLKI